MSVTFEHREDGDGVVVADGFFWLAPGERPGFGLMTTKEHPNLVVNCALVPRPRWWQVRAWLRALRFWLLLAFGRSLPPSAFPKMPRWP